MRRKEFWEDLGLPETGPHLTAYDTAIINMVRDQLNQALDLIEDSQERLKKLDDPIDTSDFEIYWAFKRMKNEK